MLQEALDEGQGVQGHGLPGLVAGLIAEGDRAVVQADEPPVGQGHPVDVGGQVFQGGAAIADGLTVHHPRRGPGVRGDLGEQLGGGCFQGIPERGAEDGAQGGPGDQKFRMRRCPRPGCWVDAPGGQQIVDMEMVAPRTIPGMQHPDQADRAAEPLRIAGERLQGVGGGLKQQVVDELLMRAGAGIQGVREGAGDEKIGDGQQVLQLCVAPMVGAVRLALGTMAIAAGVVAVLVCPALGAIVACPTQHRGAAVFDVPERLCMTGEHPVPVRLAVGWAVGPEDVREFQHP